jgi:hypothetical protein
MEATAFINVIFVVFRLACFGPKSMKWAVPWLEFGYLAFNMVWAPFGIACMKGVFDNGDQWFKIAGVLTSICQLGLASICYGVVMVYFLLKFFAPQMASR